MDEPVVSIVIPVGQDSVSPGQCLEAVLRQDYGKKEVIVVCDPRASANDSLPAGSDEMRIIKERAPVPPTRLINDGMRAARGHIKILLKPRCLPVGDRWIRQMLEPFEDETVGVVVSQTEPAGAGRRGLAERLLESVRDVRTTVEDDRPVRRELVGQRCDAYRASLLADIGYFGEQLPEPGEAVAVSMRIADAGYRILLSDTARANWGAGRRRGLGDAFRKALEYGRADALLDKQYDLRWLNCGVHGIALFSLFLLPLALLSLPAAVILSAALFIWGGFLSLRLPLIGFEYPVSVLNFAVYVAAILAVRDGWSPGLFGKEVHPAILRQWIWLVAMLATYLLLLLRTAAGNARRTLKQNSGFLYALPVGLLSMAWWLVTGLGYLRGTLLDSVSTR
ncbi:MAG: hypothetical protein R6X33_18840 [Candidatus Brocadiia bacterium]